MVKFFTRLACVAFIEFVGSRLLYLQRYMQYRAIIFLIMACVIIVFIVSEIFIESARIECETDIKINDNEQEPTIEDFLDCLDDLIEKTRKER